MTVEQRIREALLGSQPAPALRALVNDLAREGQSKAHIVAALEASIVQERQRDDANESSEEIMLDVLDALHGACHSSARIDVG